MRSVYIPIIILTLYCGACSSSNPSGQNSSGPVTGDTSNPTQTGPGTGNLPPPTFPEQGNPSLSENFASLSTNFNSTKSIPDGMIQFGILNGEAQDSKIAQLIIPGHPEYGQNDFKSPPGVQLESLQSFAFGTFRNHLQASACAQANEGVIYGIFTYQNDGSDNNVNGIIDNNEIDIEISCDSPDTIFLTLWTDYSSDSSFRKVTRKINLKTGSYIETKAGEENQWALNQSGQLTTFPGISSIGEWLDVGFTWKSNKVEFFLYSNGIRYSLWIYQDSNHIPQHAAPFLYNVWHTPTLWSNDGIADYPSSTVLLKLDTFSYFQP